MFCFGVFTVFVASLVAAAFIKQGTNNVCKTFEDYYTDCDNNKNCYYNPDADLTVPEIIQRHGYPVQTYEVTTEDGYVLTVFRIPYGKNSTKAQEKHVFIQHGVTSNSGAFVTTGRKSLGFILADSGFDVWLGNFRGTRYSINHTTLHKNDIKYWDFSFHENGVYDVRAQVDFIYNITQQKIYYIGYSMGSSTSFIYSTTYPEEAYEKVNIFIHLAPSAFQRYSFIVRYFSYVWPLIKIPLKALTNGRIHPFPPVPQPFFKYICLPYRFQMEFCQIPEMIAYGFDYEQNDPETLPVTLQYNSDSISIKTLSHYAQLAHSSNFEQFDYGTDENIRRYGSSTPPHYNLTKVRTPNYMIIGLNDRFGVKEDIEDLRTVLRKEANPYEIYIIPYKKFNHLDFLAGKDVVPLLYNHLVKFITEH